MKPGWHYLDSDEFEDMSDDQALCPRCDGMCYVVAIQRLKPRNWLEAIAEKEGVGRMRRLYACEDCDHEFID